ncbi:MAG: pseudouridine synthase [Candidatus Bathyarchaeota archaeon]
MYEYSLQKIRSIADYQFGKGVGAKFFSEDSKIIFSRNTGKIRYIYLENDLLATLRPTTGLFILTVSGAKRMMCEIESPKLWVKIEDEAEPFVSRGRSVFAKHVKEVDEEIRPNEEVIVINSKNKVLAVGRALLSGIEMKTFCKGVAVNVRHGVAEKS